MGWTALGHVSPYYPLYALLFLSTGLTEGQVSGLFALWSGVGFLAEVPAGALADRWSRRGSLVLASLLEAGAFAVWTARPGLDPVELGLPQGLPARPVASSGVQRIPPRRDRARR